MSKKFTAEEQVTRAYDAYMIKNVMGRHAYYHSWGMHPEEFETIWSKRDDVSWGNNGGYQMGRETLIKYYVEPHIGAEPKPGELFMHTLTTPLIEIADDGQTAQAMWYTPGYGSGPDGGVNWMHERYAIDFIKEDGEWKIWHFFVGTDFSMQFGTKLSDPKEGPGGPPPGGEPEPDPNVLRLPGITDPKFGWPNYPPFPTPYATFSETVSYGPEPFLNKEGK